MCTIEHWRVLDSAYVCLCYQEESGYNSASVVSLMLATVQTVCRHFIGIIGGENIWSRIVYKIFQNINITVIVCVGVVFFINTFFSRWRKLSNTNQSATLWTIMNIVHSLILGGRRRGKSDKSCRRSSDRGRIEMTLPISTLEGITLLYVNTKHSRKVLPSFLGTNLQSIPGSALYSTLGSPLFNNNNSNISLYYYYYYQ